MHINLGLLINFAVALNKDGRAFAFLTKIFTRTSETKQKAWVIFDGNQIRELIKNPNFYERIENKKWNAKSTVTNFLSNHRSLEYERVVEKFLWRFQALGARMSMKIHYLIQFSSENCGDFSEDEGEQFHRDTKVMQERYKALLDVYC